MSTVNNKPGAVVQNQTKTTTVKTTQKTSLTVNYDDIQKRVGLGKMDAKQTGLTKGVALPPSDEDGTSPEQAQRAGAVATSILSPGSGGGPATLDLSTPGLIAAAQRGMQEYDETNGFDISKNLLDESTPEERQRIANQFQEFQTRIAIHNDEVQQASNAEKALTMSTSMTATFAKNGIEAPVASGKLGIDADASDSFMVQAMHMSGTINIGLDKAQNENPQDAFKRILMNVEKLSKATSAPNADVDRATWQNTMRPGAQPAPAVTGGVTANTSDAPIKL